MVFKIIFHEETAFYSLSFYTLYLIPKGSNYF